jgi:hypothetical protein
VSASLVPQAYANIGRLVEGASLSFGSNTVAHGLGRVPVGWITVADDAVPILVAAHKNSSPQSVTQSEATGSFSAALCQTELYDTGADFNNTTGVFTAPHSGWYVFDGMVGLETALTDAATIAGGWYDGTNTILTASTTQDGSVASGTGFQRFTLAHAMYLAASTTIYPFVWHNSAAARNIPAGYAAGCRISIRSDDAMAVTAVDATNLTIYSARARTASFWVW